MNRTLKRRVLGTIGMPGYFTLATAACLAAVSPFWGHWVVAALLLVGAVACPIINQRSLVAENRELGCPT